MRSETRAHVDQAFPDVFAADAAEFHARTSHNPRVQATVLEATSTIKGSATPRPLANRGGIHRSAMDGPAGTR